MSDSAYLENLKKYGADDPTPDDIAAIEAELHDGPDRGMAVVMASLLNGRLGAIA